jgi:hypothetical protein
VTTLRGESRRRPAPRSHNAQLTHVYVRRSEAHPEQRHHLEWVTVYDAYREAFPVLSARIRRGGVGRSVINWAADPLGVLEGGKADLTSAP